VPTFEVCRKYACPVMLHAAIDGVPEFNGYRDPHTFEPLAAEFPEVPLLVAHMGGEDEALFQNALELAKRRSNVYLTTSQTRSEFVERAVEAIGPERLIFATDWSPVLRVVLEAKGTSPHKAALEVVNNARIGQREKELIFGENLANLVGI
jgi:predicted TIM-barrel fold metal-dependent hydrolase